MVNSKDKLVSYTDLHYTELLNSQKSTSGHIFMLSDGFLSHQSKLESTITLLLYKAECILITKAKKEVL